MPTTPIVTGNFQESFYILPEAASTQSVTGVDIDDWADIELLDNSFYRMTLTGHYEGDALTAMQIAFVLGHTPDAFAVSCHLHHDLATPVVQNLITPGDFTANIAPLVTTTVRPFSCEGIFQVQGDMSLLTVQFRSMVVLQTVTILPGSMLRLQQLRLPS